MTVVTVYSGTVAKARAVLRALLRDGWQIKRESSLHKILVKGSRQMTFAFHDKEDLGAPAMRAVAKEFGYSIEELRKLL